MVLLKEVIVFLPIRTPLQIDSNLHANEAGWLIVVNSTQPLGNNRRLLAQHKEYPNF